MIASDHGGLADLVEHGRTGLLATPNDIAALAAGMQALIDSPQLRMKLEQGALARAELFKAKSVVPKIELIYRDANALRSSNGSAAPMTEAPL
jgi:glycosyltransferase involved in cell wall biosynthesis